MTTETKLTAKLAERQMTRLALARATNINTGQIGRYCRGPDRPNAENGQRIANALRCATAELWEGSLRP